MGSLEHQRGREKVGRFGEILADHCNLVFYAIHGIRNNANRKDAILRNLPYLGIAGVGIGSAIFHATLKNYTQWCKSALNIWGLCQCLIFILPLFLVLLCMLGKLV